MHESWTPTSMIQHFGGNEALVRQLVTLFIESCPRMLESLRAAWRDGDLHRLGRAAHALKGSATNFTTEGPAKTAQELERLCTLGRKDEVEATLQRLEQDVARLVSAMQAFERSPSRCAS